MHGSAVPRPPARGRRWPHTGAPPRPCWSRDPLSTTTTLNPAGTVGSRSSRAAASSRHGSTRSHTVSTSATVGRSGVRETALPPYELVTPFCRGSRGPVAHLGSAPCRPRPRFALPGSAPFSRGGPALVGFGAPHWLDWAVAARAPRNASPHEVPPLHGLWRPKLFGPGTIPAVLVGPPGLAVRRRPGRPARRGAGCCSRRTPASLAWMLSLALVDGSRGLSRSLGNPYEYLRTAREVGSVAHPPRDLRRPDPLRRRGQLAHPRGGTPTRDAAVLRRPREGGAGRRPGRRGRGHRAGGVDGGRGAGHAAGAGRRGGRRDARRRSWC